MSPVDISVELVTAVCVLCLQFPTTGAGNCSIRAADGDDRHMLLHERRLLKCLLHDEYDEAVRPATDPSKPVHVVVDSVIATIVDLDERTGILTTDFWLLQMWTDPQLAWDPDSFGGLTEIRLPIEYMWTPSIVLHNNADSSEYKTAKLAVVNSSGVVIWQPRGRLRSYCNVDLRLFPFDTQHCFLAFGPWTYDTSLVTVGLNPAVNTRHRKFTEKSTEWNTAGYSCYVREIAAGLEGLVDTKQYQVIIFYFTLERTSVFYKYILIGPSVLLVVLTLCLYWIPVQSGERFVLAAGVFVSAMLTVLLLEGYLPSHIERLPVVASYIGYSLVLAVLTVIVSAIVYNCHHRDVRSAAVPRIIRRMFLGWVSRLCCVSTPSYSPVSSLDDDGHPVGHQPRELYDLQPDSAADVDRRIHSTVASSSSSSSASLEQTLSDIRQYLRLLAAAAGGGGDVGSRQGSLSSHRDIVVGEWQRVALVIDRVSFVLFSLISVIVTIALYAH